MNKDTTGTVVLGFGPQTIEWIGKASKLCGKDAVMCPQTARMAGANLAAGMPDALSSLRKQLEAGALSRATADNPGLSLAAVKWMSTGERGVSSETMFSALTGVDLLDGDHGSHPWDTYDFRRCRLLLEQVPELVPLLPKMADVSEVWKDLVYLWDDICKAMDTEAPNWRHGVAVRCPDTDNLIKRAIGR